MITMPLGAPLRAYPLVLVLAAALGTPVLADDDFPDAPPPPALDGSAPQLPIVTPAANEAEAFARLDGALNDWTGLAGQFMQTVVGEDGGVQSRARGTVAVQRPGRFRWSYEVPYRQLIVSAGDEVQIYDEDLMQVTVGTINDTQNDPAARLLREKVPLKALFAVEFRGPGYDGDLAWATLTPKEPGATYERVEVGLAGDELAALKLADQFGQITVIEFSNVERDPALDPAQFVFEVPPGVDVVRMAE